MSTANNPDDNDDSSDEKISDDITRAFENVSEDTDEPEVLKLIETDHDVLRREMDNKPVASIYHCPVYDCKAYYAVRDEENHYFKIGEGYPIDDSILQQMAEIGVEKVFIGLMRDKGVLEFNIEQYLDSDTFDKGHGVQRCAAKDVALKLWPNAVGSVIVDE